MYRLYPRPHTHRAEGLSSLLVPVEVGDTYIYIYISLYLYHTALKASAASSCRSRLAQARPMW